MKDVQWFGNGRASEGKEVVKMAGKAIVVAGAIVVTGIALGVVGDMFSGE